MGTVSYDTFPSRLTIWTWEPNPLSFAAISRLNPKITLSDMIITAMPIATLNVAMRTITLFLRPPVCVAIRRARKYSRFSLPISAVK